MKLINAENMVLGRLASTVAELALKGEQIAIVNSEKAVITGTLTAVMIKFERRKEMHAKANPDIGPRLLRGPAALMKDAIKGMVPNRERGKKALHRVKAYVGIPKIFAGKKMEIVENAKLKSGRKYVHLDEVSGKLGWKW